MGNGARTEPEAERDCRTDMQCYPHRARDEIRSVVHGSHPLSPRSGSAGVDATQPTCALLEGGTCEPVHTGEFAALAWMGAREGRPAKIGLMTVTVRRRMIAKTPELRSCYLPHQ
jgi:hypothetical protein